MPPGAVLCEHVCWPLAVGTGKVLAWAAAPPESISGPWATWEVVLARGNVPLSVESSALGRIPPRP